MTATIRWAAAMLAMTTILWAGFAAGARAQDTTDRPPPSWAGTTTEVPYTVAPPNTPAPIPPPSELPLDANGREYHPAYPDARLADVDVQALAANVRAWLQRQGFRVYDYPVWVTPELTTSYYPNQTVWAAATQLGPIIRTALTARYYRWYAALAEVLIHEYLHSVRDVTIYRDVTPAERRIEEGAITAASDELTRRFLKARYGLPDDAGVPLWDANTDPYSRFAAMVRGVSRRATGRPVNSPEARTWRYRLVKADRAARAVMWARATGGAR